VTRLDTVPWGKAPVAGFVGRLIAAKGLQTLCAAMPFLWRDNPLLYIVAVGHGPLREVGELFLRALKTGNVPWAEAIAQWGSPTEGESGTRYFGVSDYFQALKKTGRWDEYWHEATRMPLERWHFTGYLDHAALARLLPLTDCALFPSVVPEAGPMVLLEAASCGSFPLGTDRAGMAFNLTRLFEGLPAESLQAARLPIDPPQTTDGLVRQLPQALKLGPKILPQLRANCVRHFDWANLATQLLAGLASTRRTHAA
jgi:glycosyltransferase involved in cell wall biosynthesis